MNFRPVFVETIPKELEHGVLYVSMEFATVIHSCACGCGNRVVTRLAPANWQITFDGRAISLYPSVGNWSFPCRSHYWIRRNEVVWAETWEEYSRGDRTMTPDANAIQGDKATLTVDSEPTVAAYPVVEPSSLWDRMMTVLRRKG